MSLFTRQRRLRKKNEYDGEQYCIPFEVIFDKDSIEWLMQPNEMRRTAGRGRQKNEMNEKGRRIGNYRSFGSFLL